LIGKIIIFLTGYPDRGLDKQKNWDISTDWPWDYNEFLESDLPSWKHSKASGSLFHWRSIFLSATDLNESLQTNHMRYHQTVFCIQLETANAQAKIFFNFWKFSIFFQEFSKFEIFKWPEMTQYEMKLKKIRRLMTVK
jgi:hypothetical protein